jgi:hypothetical protein
MLTISGGELSKGSRCYDLVSELYATPKIGLIDSQLRTSPTMCHADDGARYLIPEMVDHVQKVARMVVPVGCIQLVFYI